MIFKKKKKTPEPPKVWNIPGGQIQELTGNIIPNATHTLIAGAAGSGKSVLINAFIYATLAQKSPNEAQFCFIDLKRVELYQWRNIPHCIGYAEDLETTVHHLSWILSTIDKRYQKMQQTGIRRWNDAEIYVVIDELADLLTSPKKREITQLLSRISQIGRAAGVHIVAATQRPTRDIINGQIQVNFDLKIALKTFSAQDSRNILGIKGAELLPRFGECLILDGIDLLSGEIHKYEDEELEKMAKFWEAQSWKIAR